MDNDSSMLQVESIEYDPLKAILGRMVARNVFMRWLFYKALGALFLRQWHVRAVLRTIRRNHDIHDIFDAGSGYGQYTYFMGRLFPHSEILAVDVKSEQVADCNWFTERVGQKNTAFITGDLTEFRRPESFDLALSVDVMEHILDDAAVYRNVFASLRPRGLFVITTPATEREHSEQDVDSVVGEHVREGYTKREFIEKMGQAGFQIQTMKYVYGPVFGKLAWQMLQRIPMRLLSVSKAYMVLVIPWMLIMYLPAALCMFLDVHLPNRKGGGWVLVAQKP
jgi:SAM-dependent methyltransferase